MIVDQYEPVGADFLINEDRFIRFSGLRTDINLKQRFAEEQGVDGEGFDQLRGEFVLDPIRRRLMWQEVIRGKDF